MKPSYKPVGGVERVTLYPANAVETALFSNEGCEISLVGTPIEVELIDDESHYEEELENKNGITRLSHRLCLTANRKCAEAWLDKEFLELAAIDGVVAVVTLNDGRTLIVGYSAHFEAEQPLRLHSLTSTSGSKLNDTPWVELQLRSYDTAFSAEIIYTNNF